jgi:TonB family protein
LISVGRTSVLLAASLCCMQLAIAEEATTQKPSENNASKQASTAPVKPLQAECDRFLSDIRCAEKDGIGTKTYLDLFKGIESSIEKGEPLDQLKDRLNRLSKALEEQIARAKIIKMQKPIHSEPSHKNDIPAINEANKSKDSNVDFGPYVADVQKRIKRFWFPPRGNESKKVVVTFQIFANGTTKNLRLLRSSGLDTADSAALKAVEMASPLLALPAGAPNDVDMEFTFDYNTCTGGVIQSY